jgi:exonuclease VII small subunit
MATTLADIVKDPNYVNASAATKKAIFDKHSATDPNYTGASAATQKAIRVKFGVDAPSATAAAPSATAAAPPAEDKSELLQMAKNVGGGLIRGAGSIGATFIRPFESAEENVERRRQIDEGLTTILGSDPSSTGYQAGKLTSEVAGTAGLAGAIARPFAALAGPVTRFAPAVGDALTAGANALRTGGLGGQFSGGIQNFFTRTGAGAVTGGAASLAVDPSTVEEGAAIGAVIPMIGGSPITRKAASAVAHIVKNIAAPLMPGATQTAVIKAIADSLDNDPVKLERAADMFAQGKTVAEVATELNSTGLAAMAKAVRGRGGTADAYAAQAKDISEGLINKLAGVDASAQNKLAGVAQDKAAREAALTAEQQRLGAVPPVVNPRDVGEIVTEGRKASIAARKASEVDPAYAAALERPDKFSFAPVVATAERIRAQPEVAFDAAKAPNTTAILNRYQSTPATPGGGVDSLMRPIPGTPAKPFEGGMEEADALIKAINEDIGALRGSGLPQDKFTMANLKDLKQSVLESMPADARAAYQAAMDKARTRVIEPFRKGWLSNLERLGKTKRQMLVPSKVVNTAFAQGDEAAREFVDAFSDSPDVLNAMKAGILGKYRNVVVRDGVIDPSAHAKFMEKYRDSINAMDTSGMNLKSTLDSYGSGAKSPKDIVDTVAQEFKEVESQVKDVVSQVNSLSSRTVDGKDATYAEALKKASATAKDIPGMNEELKAIREQLERGSYFDDLAKEGLAAAPQYQRLLSEAAQPEPQLLSRVATLALNLLRRFRGEIDSDIASQLAMDLLTPARGKVAFEAAAGRAARGATARTPRVPSGARVVAPSVVTSNAMGEENRNNLRQ